MGTELPKALQAIQEWDRAVRNWRLIVIHHSATKDGVTSDWEAIRKWHTGQTGSDNPASPEFNKYTISPMTDIGYHFGIELVNHRLEYRIGRPLSRDGAHCVGLNRHGIGICVVGNFDLVDPSERHYFLCACLCRELQRKFDIPTYNIVRHSEYAPKTCPGKLFSFQHLLSAING